jgi:hypothetical protein
VNERRIVDMTPDEIRSIVDAFQSREKLRSENPLRPGGRIGYYDIARSMFPVEKMPDGAVYYCSTSPEPWCASQGHPGQNGPASGCSHPECVVRTVMES